MAIECKFSITPLLQDEFHVIDKTVMQHAFDIQNEIGRLCDELVYQKELAYRCEHDGLDVLTEAMVCVTHKTFSKPYYLDMLVKTGSIYELKTAAGLHQNHSNQLINYLLLSALNHGKLINFRPSSVEHRFVSTQLTPELRYKFKIDPDEWVGDDKPSQLLMDIVSDLIHDWGAFLDIGLYKEAILHFLPEQSLQPTEIYVNNRAVGSQKICLLQPDTGVHISAIKEGIVSYAKHVRRLFDHTKLTRIQWVNFKREIIQLITLKK